MGLQFARYEINFNCREVPAVSFSILKVQNQFLN